jgi:hypothetical protein
LLKDHSVCTNYELVVTIYYEKVTDWLKKKGRAKVVSVHFIQVCRGSRGIAPLTLNLGTRYR